MDGERHIRIGDKSECSESGRHRDAGKTNVFDNFLSRAPPIFAKRIFNFRPLKSTKMEKRGKRNTISIEEFDRKLQKLIREVQSEGRHGTANNYRHTRSSFFRFIQEPNTEFSLDAPTVERYEQWLRSRGVSRNSSSFYMRNLRAMCNLLFKRGAIADAELFADVYTGIAKTRKRAVSEQTLARIKQADLTEFPQLARCRDLFLFCFYCRGMAFVALAYLRQENIDGHYIRYTRRKTGQNLEIHIEPCMKEIMLRHAGSGGYLFPILTSDNPRKAYEQYRSAICTFNRSLKILSQRLDIPALSSYMSRHTWATIARYRQIPLAIISEGMGHNSENTTRIYLSSFNQQVLDEANKNVITI